MGRFNVQIMCHMTKQEFRILTAIEIGMKNHEMVPGPLVHQLANLRSGGVSRKLYGLAEHRLVSYDRGKHCDGYRLTNLGYDFLALKCLLTKNIIKGVGSQFGCGKESDIYLVQDVDNNSRCMKIHRLGRNSFRKVKNKRDYHKSRHISSWLYLSRISAQKEYNFMKVLFENGFPVPEPFGCNRHIVIMEEIIGDPLNHIKEIENPGKLFSKLMNLILKLARYGLIHCDFNEFNILVAQNDEPVLIDFPQMVSISHPDAEEYFDRDVECIAAFFKRRYRFETEEVPVFDDVVREHDLDVQVRASGYDTHEPEAVSTDEESDEENDLDKPDQFSDRLSLVNEKKDRLSDEDEDDEFGDKWFEVDEAENNLSDKHVTVSEDEDHFGVRDITVSEDEEHLSDEDISVSEDEGHDNELEDKNICEYDIKVPDCVISETDTNEEDISELCRQKGISKKLQRKMEQAKLLNLRRAYLKEERERALELGDKFCSRSSFSFDETSSVYSYSSTCSTRSQSSFVLGRVKLEAQDRARMHMPKKAIRAKGEANAYNRKRKENLNTIKEVKEAEFF